MIEFFDARDCFTNVYRSDKHMEDRYALAIGCEVWTEEAPWGFDWDADGDGAVIVGTLDELADWVGQLGRKVEIARSTTTRKAR